MEQDQSPQAEINHAKSDRNEVYVLRDWREYVGESLLIIFSVLLALVLTEVINSIHEKSNTNELLRNIQAELIKNKEKAQQQYNYQKVVLKNIDSALSNQAFRNQIFSNNEFYLTKYIAKEGVTYRDLDDVAWQIAKSNNIASKVGLKTIQLLTDIYDNQARITKLEEEVGKVFLSREARDSQKAMVTLIMVKDNYLGWSFDRTPALLKKYDEAINLLGDKD